MKYWHQQFLELLFPRFNSYSTRHVGFLFSTVDSVDISPPVQSVPKRLASSGVTVYGLRPFDALQATSFRDMEMIHFTTIIIWSTTFFRE